MLREDVMRTTTVYCQDVLYTLAMIDWLRTRGRMPLTGDAFMTFSCNSYIYTVSQKSSHL